MIRHPLLQGAVIGAAIGALNAGVTALSFAAVAQSLIHLPIDPYDLLVAGFMAPTVTAGALFGLVAAALLRRRVEADPGLLVHAVPPVYVLLGAAAGSTMWRLLLMQAGATHLLAWLVRRAAWRSPRLGAALAATLVALWGGGVLLLHTPAGAPSDRPPAPAGAPNVVLVVLDTVRADHLSTWGYDRPTTPALDRLAAQGVVFEHTYAPASWTAPSHASMFTGLYPSWHGCHEEHRVLNPDRQTVAELLAAQGYDTSLYTGNPWLGPHSGLSQGFDAVTPSWRLAIVAEQFPATSLLLRWGFDDQDKGASTSNRALQAWLRERDAARPFFAVVNYFEAHMPYAQVPRADRDQFLPPGVTPARSLEVSHALQAWANSDPLSEYDPDPDREVSVALYDGGIRNADRRLEELVELLRSAGELDNTLLIVTADHGEMFGEHRAWGHQITLYEGTLGVPLLVVWPGGAHAGQRVQTPASLIDLFPTMLQAAGVAPPPGTQGLALQSLLDGAAADRVLFSEQGLPDSLAAKKRVRRLGADPETWEQRAAQTADLRLIRGPGAAEQAWRLGADGEQPVDPASPELAPLRAALDRFTAEAPDRGALGEAPEMDAGTRQQLEALGYLH
jgi:arylsulfatase A-like enzyme